MPDQTTTVAQLRQAMRQFVAERDWEQFHSPKNLAMGLSVEVAELMEHYLWMDLAESHRVTDDPARRTEVSDEIADVALYLLAFANVLGLDLSDAITAKLARTAVKYPVDRIRGKYKLDDTSGEPGV